MARPSGGLVGSFPYLDSLLEAIQRLHHAGYWNLQALSPVPHHAIDEALEKPASPVRVFTLIGCLLGATTGLVLTIATSLHYPLITGGKPIVSLPPFLIIVFELTILFGGLSTLGGMLLNARLPRVHIVPAYDPRFSEDRFGLWVRCEAKDFDVVTRLLETAGAEEVRRAGGEEADPVKEN
jgi:molybdopterin-containing oxidoreductase family membrane subunit